MKKVLIIATVQSHIAQFHIPLIEMFKNNGYEIHVAARNNLNEKGSLEIKEVDRLFNLNFSRSPFSLKNYRVYKELSSIIDNEKYDIIYCNTPVGGILGRLSSAKSRKLGTKVYYTAHGFHFYRGAPLINWLLYYPIEKFMSRYTDTLITITKEDYEIAKRKKFKAKNIVRLNGVGVDPMKFKVSNKNNKELNKLKHFNILVIGELNNNKNQITILKALKLVIKKNKNILINFAGNGPRKSKLQTFINNNNLNDNAKLLGYRNDIPALINQSNIIISASLREGLPLNIIEAIMSGKPVIGSYNRGHNEIINKDNGVQFDAFDFNELSRLIIKFSKGEFNHLNNKETLFNSVKKYSINNVKKQYKEIFNLKQVK